MNREETILLLQTVGGKIAKEFGFDNCIIGEDRQKGFWGERLTEYLEKENGECTKEIRWCSPDNPKNYVEFRFRFANPVLAIHTFERGDEGEHLASLEFSETIADWTHYDKERELPKWKQEEGKTTGHYVDYVKTGDFKNTETMLWGSKGMQYLELIQDRIEKEKQILLKNSEKEESLDDYELDERE